MIRLPISCRILLSPPDTSAAAGPGTSPFLSRCTASRVGCLPPRGMRIQHKCRRYTKGRGYFISWEETMHFKRYCVLAAVGLAGCHTVDDVRSQPVQWTATYAVSFDAMANCLAAQSARDFDVTPQLYQSERRADVTLGIKGGYSLLGEYQVRQTTASDSEVKWRSVSSLASTELARNRANRCARSAMAAMPPPTVPTTEPRPPQSPAWLPSTSNE